MNYPIWPILFFLVFGLVSCGKKQDDKAGTSSSGQAPEILPEDTEERYKVVYVRAAQAFSRNNLDEALKYLELADQAKPNQASNANLRGAIYTRKRDWANAESSFRNALKLQPDLPMAQFNLGEVLFLNNKYGEAREKFQIFLNSQPNNDLGIYKIYLCDLLGGNKAKATDFLSKLEPSPNSPLYYFAKAAEAFQRGDKPAGMEFVSSAYRIYPGDANSTFADSLVEKGYLSGEQNSATIEDNKKPKIEELKALLPAAQKN
jgi:tetratricopeptide (TPR) repeat protein